MKISPSFSSPAKVALNPWLSVIQRCVGGEGGGIWSVGTLCPPWLCSGIFSHLILSVSSGLLRVPASLSRVPAFLSIRKLIDSFHLLTLTVYGSTSSSTAVSPCPNCETSALPALSVTSLPFLVMWEGQDGSPGSPLLLSMHES